MIFRRPKYRDDPARNIDGRNVRPDKGSLKGEGAEQRVKDVQVAYPLPLFREEKHPPIPTGAEERKSYYGQPVLKQPVWIWSVPTYFYVGGTVGASALLAGAAQLPGDEALRPFIRRLRWVTAIGGAVAGGLLVYDLGRPERFLNMLRVFRPTSPMSMGAWMLTGLSAFAGVAALASGAPRPLQKIGDAAGMAAAVLAIPFTGYTAVLVSNTAVPVWKGARKSLPFLFTFSAMAGASALLELMEAGPRARRIARRFGLVGRLGELAAGEMMKRELALPEVNKAIEEGTPGRLMRTGKVLTAISLGLSLLPTRVRSAHRLGGLLGSVAVLATKWGVFAAGKASANNPHATFESQGAAVRPEEEVTAPELYGEVPFAEASLPT